MDESVPPGRWHRRTVYGALALVAFDGVFFCHGRISPLIAIGLALYLPFLFTRYFIKKDRWKLVFRLKNVAIYALAVAAVLGMVDMNNERIRSRTEPVIMAVKAFHAEHHVYPESLDELIPRFVDEVPDHISYRRYSDEIFVTDSSRPPFYGVKRYRLSTGKWEAYD